MTIVATEEIVPHERLRSFAERLLATVGMPAADAALAADSMIWAELRGLPMHGVSAKLPQCVARIRAGGTVASVDWDAATRTVGSVTLVNAANGWGQVAATRAMRAAIATAREGGVGLAIVRESSSAAAMGSYVSLAVAERMVGIAITNGPALMPPVGGTTRAVGNQGFAIACPAAKHPPLIFDSALSLISTGEIHTHQERGKRLAPGLMLDRAGRPTTDPVEALAGLYIAIGGHRGFGLALMWELLAGVLSGGRRFGQDVGGPDAHAEAQSVSHFLLAIDPGTAQPYETFLARVDALIDQVHASPPAAGVDRIYVPGERGTLTADARRRDGVPISAKRAAVLRALGAEHGIPWP